jgi:CTP:molybdopterin cytidylyltransferase MocA
LRPVVSRKLVISPASFLRQSQGSEGPRTHPVLVRRTWGQVLARTGDTEGARTALEESLRLSRDLGTDYETALTLQALAEIDHRLDVADEASAILDRLGVAMVTR